MQRRSFSWVALVAAGIAGVVALFAAKALAARSTASTFELVFQGRQELMLFGDYIFDARLVGTFTSGSPFCESGTTVDPSWAGDNVRRYTCSDGSGSLALEVNPQTAVHGGTGSWTIVEGSGRYAGLHGKGTYREELLDEDPDDLVVPFRTTFQGFADADDEAPADADAVAPADADAVAPSLAFTSASATKLRRPAGAYSIHVALTLRDDVAGNTVAYRLRVKEGPEHPRDRRLPQLASKEGSTASGSVSTTLRVLPSSKRVRSVKLLLSGSDPNGNEVSIARSLNLPRS
jgi:hypothetical protein